ncbi:phosphonate metabolism protein PhnM [Rhodococcus opacus PD630]|uniref:alpha-D-ribose 1-methylphosphonate 5-triphosphate diphosphatase n=1 Tax=Rhodococcus TaxID=1827 RepID=UPI00029CCD3B|nr:MULTISPECIES: alpha-D-ribose 1-methylphosphonate 5-triphosphate diphosphatase [Rhodococcus]KXF56066.1 phosphonate metabolism protein PhnM [Rhodococcus sp. SC4]AHK34995.1 Protein phnM [Rhodococcus opacus PD630]EHI39136.1 phosphonate metabolism protein PhnM [Rhodococcus opacus PD630]KXX55716.1 phosphonate metabolism protein PhnM [Rhodococcus sp. LB1]PBC55772.1 alpha-D-ribose 1-methylphosphonate 5-triphosphate diphosphatase [Rhodococcus sp. ACPA1]
MSETAQTLEQPTAWSLQQSPRDYVLGHVRAVLPAGILDDARIVVRDGRIVEVGEPTPGTRIDVDGGGLFCLPGLVDVHSDGLERERLPRPGAELPWMFSMMSFEGKLRAAGVTTVFHGASFSDREAAKNQRSVHAAMEMCEAIAGWNERETDGRLVDHRVLHRLDVRSAAGLAALRNHFDHLVATGQVGADLPAVISHEDHTPGIGQYADRTFYERYMAGIRGISMEEARLRVDEVVRERESNIAVREDAMEWLAGRGATGSVRIFGHDPESAVEIADLARRGGNVAEFPTTEEAAREARDRGMSVVMGGPNVLRGGSHSGNVSAVELARLGLVTALASDYLPSSLLGAAFTLAADDTMPLHAAVSLITSGAATAVGLSDRGALEPGQRADLVLVGLEHRCPVVRSVLRAQ